MLEQTTSDSNSPTDTNINDDSMSKEGDSFDFLQWMKTKKENVDVQAKKWQQTPVIWFPVNDLITPENPVPKHGEEFEFEKLPLHEAARRIYLGEFDKAKFLVQQRESATLSFVISFFLGSITGGAIGYFQGRNEVNENYVKEYGGKTLDNKQVKL